ncbi:MAG: non-reducing end alpha-L-arabinofuranosidase family hydrolase [Myxococcota bacterium]
MLLTRAQLISFPGAFVVAAAVSVSACSTASTGGAAAGGAKSINMNGGNGSATGGTNPLGGTGSNSGGISALGGTSSNSGGISSNAGGINALGGTGIGGAAAGGVNCCGTDGKGGGRADGQSGAAGSGAGGKSAAGGNTATGGATASGGNGASCALPSTFKWTTGAPVIVPKSDATHDLVAVKDPTVVRYNNRWHLFASSVTKTGVYSMVYLNFADWNEAGAAPFYYMDQTPNFNTYTAAPQVFYFAPQKKWYLIFQSGPPMYSTNDDITMPSKWTKPAPFYASEPVIIKQNDGWLDYWIICDTANCHLFFSDDHGRWYKAKTSIANFPNGFSDPIIVMQDAEAGRLFEGSSVYKVSGSNKYLALIEAFDQSSNWKRYFRSWTADSLDGPWQPLADSGTKPFVGKSNVTFTVAPWTDNISHGDMVRSGYDQTQLVDPCNFQFVYQGFDPTADGSPYNSLPWKLGLLNHTN